MTFANYEYLFLLLLLIPYIVWYLLCHDKSSPAIRVSSTDAYRIAPKTFRTYLLHMPFLCRIVCFTAAILALARPQTSNNWTNKSIEGIDIMLCMDVSTSMLAEDLKPNRIEAAKKVAIEFINGRPNDNIGLTVFAGEAYTQCPMTVDHAVLLNLLSEKIKDSKFINLIGKFLKAGYMEDWVYHKTYSGTPQGGILSPILANIYQRWETEDKDEEI